MQLQQIAQRLVYFIYVRKSTDTEDKQILSIAAQIVELKEFAKRMGLYIADVIIEKQTAKTPGRPKLNKMLERIENGEANGILAWLPDRLSRNSIDSGRIIYMLDVNVLQDLKFPHFWFENTPQGKYMLANEFNSSKQYVDNLSVNTKRGLRQKVRDGHYPSIVPFGYYNDVRTKTVARNKKTAPLVRRCFELYAKGDKTCGDIADFLFANGVATKGRRKTKNDPKSAGGKRWHETKVKHMLSNIFYYGHFRYAGEVYEGKHTLIVDKALFDRVQAVLLRRSRAQKRATSPQPLTMLFRCANCDCFVTGSHKIKRQKNGNVHEYTYYRCTHKSKKVTCREPELREYALASQLVPIARSFAMPKDMGAFMLAKLDQDAQVVQADSARLIATHRARLDELAGKSQRLFDVYMDGDIEQDEYRERRAEIMSEKKSLESKVEQIAARADFWIEPMREWVKTAISLCKVDENTPHQALRESLRRIDGLNLLLKNKKVVASNDQFPISPQENIWFALRATKEKIALVGDNFPKNRFLVHWRRLELPRSQ
ncbi:recombinase family protein [Candidatus Saccharibacteria bacterium]|nr:MAG: recombinase family protein [Candidatus Saccharibacteria bacterium]